MNVRRFTARTSREALRLVREAFGEDAVVLSTQPSAGGVEVLAMAPESVGRIAELAESAPHAGADAPQREARPTRRAAATPRAEPTSVEEDVARLQMSTLSFQDYVRNRMLRRRQAALGAAGDAPVEREAAPARGAHVDVRVDDDDRFAGDAPGRARAAYAATARDDAPAREAPGRLEQRMADEAPRAVPPWREAAAPADAIRVPGVVADAGFDSAASRQHDLITELRSMKGLIEERFGALAFMERLQRRPAEARLTQKLLDCGFSPLLVRKLAEGLAVDVADETAWAARVLERNLRTNEGADPIEDQVGVYALIGATGVGKTTTTAKIAAAFATRHGAANLGLITLDAYRVAAHEQLRAYGRILGVPVHTAHDRASLEDLLELLAAKKMVLIDTAGMAQRDARTRELLDMLSHPRIQRLLVVNAASQGETTDDVIAAYRASTCAGIVLSKIDEAVKLGPALDAAIRHKLKVVGVANGQRVPEDWHRLPAAALVQRALRGGGSAAFRLDACEMNLVFAASSAPDTAAAVPA